MVKLTSEGEVIAEKGSHEFNVYSVIGDGGTPQEEIMVRQGHGACKPILVISMGLEA